MSGGSEVKEDVKENPNKVVKKKCKKCGRIVEPKGTYGHVKVSHPDLLEKWEEIKDELFEDVEVEVAEEGGTPPTEEPVIKPPDVEFTEEAIAFLEKNLPQLYGIDEKKARAIIETVRQNPEILHDPNYLFQHIKYLAPRVNDYHLYWILRSMYSKLTPPKSQQYPMLLPTSQQSVTPPLPFPTQPTQPQQPQPFQINFPQFTQSQSPIQLFPQYPPFPPQFPQYPSQVQYPIPPQASKPEKKKRTYKVVIDGEIIETDDPEEYMALKKWLDEREEAKKRMEWERQKHEKEMRKLDEEIKTIAKKHVEEEKKKKHIEVEKIGEKESEIIRSLNNRIQSLEKQLSDLRKERDEMKDKLREMEERRREEELRALRERVKELEAVARNPWKAIREQEEFLRSIGYTRTGKTLLDIIDKFVESGERSIQSFLNRLPKPKVGPRYTEAERREKISQLKERVRESEELLKAEDELIESARKMYSQQPSG